MLLALAVGCSEKAQNPSQPEAASQLVVLGKENPQIRAVMEVQDRHTPNLMAMKNVIGTATGLTAEGQPAIIVYVLSDLGSQTLAKGQALPQTIEGIPVVVEVTEQFRAMKGGGGGVSHTAKQTPPIQLGTSGGWRHDLANGYCCGGTLGALISKGGQQYILSNYHVLEADIVSGGNSRVAQAGDPVIQPALIDVNCNAANAQDVARLSGIKSLPGSNVDAAIAQVISGMVRTDGAILEVGTLSASTVGASLNQAVKKSGRTTGLTRSTVSGLNATVSVAYDNECAGGSAFTKTFTGQIVIKNRGSSFLNSGDSGSLMVEDVTTNPRAVGLLFAGSSTSAIANPIGQVLSFFGASMVGN
ncbi:hypothetical protein HUU05_12100 [candidate division KSB1 bacterium]|nr:hypothetical protein [candidate division KSB1 bacterium]